MKRKGGYILGFVLVLLIAATCYHYRSGFAYYLGFKSHRISKLRKQVAEQEKRLADVRTYQLLSKYEGRAVGIDVSEYQGEIDWRQIATVEDNFDVSFVFIRATVGCDRADLRFSRNWFGAGRHKIMRGAYHYYRPNENSIEQADNFIKNVKLEKGDLPPVLDIEKLPENQSIDSLKVGLRRWLKRVSEHYKVTPIIYSGNNYYEAFLKTEFSEYPFWIANYNFFVEDFCDDWQFWQFTQSANIKGIYGDVDVNIYSGSPQMLSELTVK